MVKAPALFSILFSANFKVTLWKSRFDVVKKTIGAERLVLVQYQTGFNYKEVAQILRANRAIDCISVTIFQTAGCKSVATKA